VVTDKCKKRQRAFTLIELLVVIAIIAILAAILFPVFAQAKASAKTAGTLSNVKQLVLAHVMYNNDNDDRSFIPWVRYPENIYTAQIIYPYCKNLSIMWDVSAPKPNLGSIADPTAPGAWGQFMTISWNMTAMYDGWAFAPRYMSAQEDPASRMLLLPFSNPQGLFNDPSQPSGDIGWYTFDGLEQSCYDTADTGYVNNPTGGVTRAAETWHAKSYVSGMLDGHAQYAKGKVLKTTDCWGQTGDFWNTNFNGQTTPPINPVATNAWSAFYLSDPIVKYWGEWWTPDR
jgi:prepilin-type N-terminal cleavage/methylation domain-containing protein